jgi:hypothetical protein
VRAPSPVFEAQILPISSAEKVIRSLSNMTNRRAKMLRSKRWQN